MAWVLQDLVVGDTYTLAIGPSTAADRTEHHHIDTSSMAGLSDAAVVQMQTVEPPTGEMSGTLLTADEYSALRAWSKRDRNLLLIDDLGRTDVIYITKFSPKRVFSAAVPWKHTWTLSFQVLAYDIGGIALPSTTTYPGSTLYPSSP